MAFVNVPATTKEEGFMLPVETVKYIAQHQTPCPTEILLADGSGRRYLRRLSVGAVGQQDVSYDAVEPWFDHRIKVSSLSSFIAAAAEYCRRYGVLQLDGNNNGAGATAIFNKTGGLFFPGADTRTFVTFARQLHPAMAALALLQQKNDHASFCLLIDRLRPWVAEYTAIRSALRRIRFDKNVTMTSQPRLIDGSSKQEFVVEMSVSGAEPSSGVKIPANLSIYAPFTTDEAVWVDAQMEIDIVFDDQKRTSSWQCVWPGAEMAHSRAVREEVSKFSEALREGGLSKVLIVED